MGTWSKQHQSLRARSVCFVLYTSRDLWRTWRLCFEARFLSQPLESWRVLTAGSIWYRSTRPPCAFVWDTAAHLLRFKAVRVIMRLRAAALHGHCVSDTCTLVKVCIYNPTMVCMNRPTPCVWNDFLTCPRVFPVVTRLHKWCKWVTRSGCGCKCESITRQPLQNPVYVTHPTP